MATMAQNRARRPRDERVPYASVTSYRAFMRHMRTVPRTTEVVPDEALPVGGKARDQLLEALRRLGFVNGLAPTTTLWRVLDDESDALLTVLRDRLAEPTRILEAREPRAALDSWFDGRGYADQTTQRARSLFLAIAADARIPTAAYEGRRHDAPTSTTPTPQPATSRSLADVRVEYADLLLQELKAVRASGEDDAELAARLEQALGLPPR